MKSLISIIALISSINGSSAAGISCSLLFCPGPCVEGIGCVTTCTDYTSCSDSAEECFFSDSASTTGFCVETCGGISGKQCSESGEECIDNPLDLCDPDKGGADCGGFCGPARCGENEEFQSCGSACPRKCGDPDPQMCLAMCIPNVCRCKDGYVLDTEYGECILEENCPTCDAENTSYDSCGSSCPEACDSDPFRMCTFQCVPGCFCDDGYVLDSDGDCILREECPTEEPVTTSDPTICGENEEYTSCGSPCQDTCTPALTWVACPDYCIEGCVCKDGYVLDDEGNCVLRENCPTPTCDDENAEYTLCGSYCPGTCSNLKYFDQISCLQMCVEGCFCKAGYVFDDEGICVLIEDCPTDMSTTPSGCEKECDTDSGYVCVDNDGSGSPGCVMIGDECDICFRLGMPCGLCPDGENSYGACEGCFWQETFFGDVRCVDTISTCPDDGTTDMPLSTEGCDENEIFKTCGTSCPRQCGDDLYIACDKKCNVGCFCKPGYVLDGEDGECIPEYECPAVTEECGENEVYDDCGTACPPVCGDLGPKICILSCEVGCRCDNENGFVLSEIDGRCIPVDECSDDEPLSTLSTLSTEEDDGTTQEPCTGYKCPGSDANTYGVMMVFGVVMSVFGWM